MLGVGVGAGVGLRLGVLVGVEGAGTIRRAVGGGRLQALGDIVDPVGYPCLGGHIPLVGLGGVVVFGHVLV
jgi:hypothetical protein